MRDAVWCQSGAVPVTAGTYLLTNGMTVIVRQSSSGRFYACDQHGVYRPGLIYRLRAELEEGVR